VNEMGSVPHFPPPPPLPASSVKAAFSGDRGEFFRLVRNGTGLELITFGFYRFWLATDIRRHLWSHTSLDGDAPEYTGRGRELLIGFLFALAILGLGGYGLYQVASRQWHVQPTFQVRTQFATISGVELEFTGINPQTKWARIISDQQKAILRAAPEIAQTKYLVAKTDTDLDGHASFAGLLPGNYWISTLNFDADAGDARLRWDVPVAVEAGHTTRVELTNLNGIDAHIVAPQ